MGWGSNPWHSIGLRELLTALADVMHFACNGACAGLQGRQVIVRIRTRFPTSLPGVTGESPSGMQHPPMSYSPFLAPWLPRTVLTLYDGIIQNGEWPYTSKTHASWRVVACSIRTAGMTSCKQNIHKLSGVHYTNCTLAVELIHSPDWPSYMASWFEEVGSTVCGANEHEVGVVVSRY